MTIFSRHPSHAPTSTCAHGSGQIDLDEFLAFMRPTSVPDVKCTASSWTQRANSTDRHPQNLASAAGVSVTDDSCYIHTGEVDGTAWSSEEGPPAAAWVEFELPQVHLRVTGGLPRCVLDRCACVGAVRSTLHGLKQPGRGGAADPRRRRQRRCGAVLVVVLVVVVVVVVSSASCSPAPAPAPAPGGCSFSCSSAAVAAAAVAAAAAICCC
jgi:hypothetical protein